LAPGSAARGRVGRRHQLAGYEGRCYVFDEARVQRFIAEGRGVGFGPTYRPWLQIQDVLSLGRSPRPFGIKFGRVHHLLSYGEWKCFLKLEGDPSIDEIQEQKPIDRFETFQIAQRLGISHPRTRDGTPYVLTLDFHVRKHIQGRPCWIPLTFRYDPETMSPRQQELMVLTREYWLRSCVSSQCLVSRAEQLSAPMRRLVQASC
jgi:hypothetical protein